MKKGNFYTFNCNTTSGKSEGAFNIYQARNGGIVLLLGDAITFLTIANLHDLRIDVSELNDFGQEDFRNYYDIRHTFNPPNYGPIEILREEATHPEGWKEFDTSSDRALEHQKEMFPSIYDMCQQLSVNPLGEFPLKAQDSLDKAIIRMDDNEIKLLWFAASGKENKYLTLAEEMYPNKPHSKPYNIQHNAFTITNR